MLMLDNTGGQVCFQLAKLIVTLNLAGVDVEHPVFILHKVIH